MVKKEEFEIKDFFSARNSFNRLRRSKENRVENDKEN